MKNKEMKYDKVVINKDHLYQLKMCLENDWPIHLLFNRAGWIEKPNEPSELMNRFNKKHAERYEDMGVIENTHGNYYKVLPVPELQKKQRTINRQKDIRHSQAYTDLIAMLDRAGYDHGGHLESTHDFIMILPPEVNGGKLFIDTIQRPSGSYNYKSGYEGQRRSIHTLGSKVRAVERVMGWLIYNRIPLRLPKVVKHG